MNLDEKIEIVKEILKDKKVAVGFSGGADSTLIAYLSSKVSSDTLAITIDNHLMPTDFIKHTQEAANLFKIKHEIIDINFYADADFLDNAPDRCYTCRNLMYSQIEAKAHEKGFDFICDGNNISDLVSDRPGILITYAKEFETPLIEAKLTSKEIHEYLNKNSIPYSRSTTCLATRIPTNTKITKEKIERISYCEDYILNNTKCEIVKVRDFGNAYVCEVDDVSELTKDDKFKQINNELKDKGFNELSLNQTSIDDNEEITINYNEGSFRYQLPFTINIEDTRKFVLEIEDENENEIITENICIKKSGLIEGNNFESYGNSLYAFMEILPKIRRNI